MNSLASYICAAFFCIIANFALVQSSLGQGPATSQDAQSAPAVAGTAAGTDAEANTNLPTQLLQPQIDVDELEIRLVPLTGDELKQLAKEWLKIVKSKTEEVVQAQVAIAKTDGAVEDAARKKLTQIDLERKDLFDKYSSVLNAWEKKGGDAKDIASYRAYRNAIIVEEARTSDFTTLVARALAWFTDEDGGIYFLKSVGIIILSVLALLIAAGVVRRLAARWIGHVPNISKLLQAFLVGIIYWIVLALGLMIVLSAVGVDITPLFALIGGASFIIAFALQDTLGNLASGLMIMIYRPFDEGDYVDVGGVAGTVKAVSIVATTVATPDNQVIVIPNKNVWGNIITNVTASETRRVDLVFGISYEDSIPETLRVLEDAVTSHPLVLKEPEPTIRVHELADSSVNFICRPWTKTSDYWTVYWDLMRRVKERFDEAGISIPYPQQDIHVKGAMDEPRYHEIASKDDGKRRGDKSKTVSIAAGDEGFEQPQDDEVS